MLQPAEASAHSAQGAAAPPTRANGAFCSIAGLGIALVCHCIS